MHESGKKILELMFRPNETVCVSHNQFGYHSIDLKNAINGPVVLIPTEDSVVKRKMTFNDAIEHITPEQIILCALNPIKGYRTDANCTAFRNFLVELDVGTLNEQMAYVKKMGMPYSAIIFSGNKSLHYLITLDRDLPSESVYRTFSGWILAAMPLADPNTGNPSRSIRIPGAFRESGKQQTLVELKGPVKIEDLVAWLKRFPDAKPQQKQRRKISGTAIEDIFKIEGVKEWVAKTLTDGVKTPNRNKKWFTIAVEFALSGFSEDDTITILSSYFEPERDFKKKEWENTIKSAFKYAYTRKG